MIQRYGLFGAYDDWKMEPDSDGEFVLFSDHVAEVERLKPRVKPLEWGNGEGEIVTADYAISAESGTWFVFRRGTLVGHGATLEAAKAAAQADYEARILAALQDRPTPTDGGEG